MNLCTCIPVNVAQRSRVMRELRTEAGNHHCRGCALFDRRFEEVRGDAQIILTAAELEELQESRWEITPAGRAALKECT